MDNPLLQVNNLQTHFKSDSGIVKAVDGVSFEFPKEKRLESSVNLEVEKVSLPCQS